MLSTKSDDRVESRKEREREEKGREKEREISIIPRKRRVSTRGVREKERQWDGRGGKREKEAAQCFGIPVAIAWRESVFFFSQRRETLHIWPAVDRGWTLIV